MQKALKMIRIINDPEGADLGGRYPITIVEARLVVENHKAEIGQLWR